eukprot:6422369-Alexandrium_andersonii.AAC.1
MAGNAFSTPVVSALAAALRRRLHCAAQGPWEGGGADRLEFARARARSKTLRASCIAKLRPSTEVTEWPDPKRVHCPSPSGPPALGGRVASSPFE